MNPGIPMTTASGKIMTSAARPIANTIGTVSKKNKHMQQFPKSLIYLAYTSTHRKESPIGAKRANTMGPIVRIPIKIKIRLRHSQVNLRKVLAGSAALNC